MSTVPPEGSGQSTHVSSPSSKSVRADVTAPASSTLTASTSPTYHRPVFVCVCVCVHTFINIYMYMHKYKYKHKYI